MIKVTLQSVTPYATLIPAIAAKVCYSGDPIESIEEKLTFKDCRNLVTRVYSMGHKSILEHVSFTFLVSGVSRIATHQFVRHRHCTFHERSQRYVEVGKSEVVMPESIKKDPDHIDSFDYAVRVCMHLYEKLINQGVPAEDARFILPQGIESQLIVTMNAAELVHIARLRCCNRAQWEIRDVARKMVILAREQFPVIFDKVGPSCYMDGRCPEGKMTCGKMKEVQEEYKTLTGADAF